MIRVVAHAILRVLGLSSRRLEPSLPSRALTFWFVGRLLKQGRTVDEVRILLEGVAALENRPRPPDPVQVLNSS